ncbi:hypothetical protein HID58_085330 [Brassica napus]|uniref:Uncharacterized protein n=1 Tax=Brassica napus TaxID=3708 RepID=A0ABQ7XNS3_BRANA|nr:hypothetical protein HID58_085330 [Brassica napus]
MDKPSFVISPEEAESAANRNSASQFSSSSRRLRNPSLSHQSPNSTWQPSDSDLLRSQCRVPRSPSPPLNPRRAIPRHQPHPQRRASSPSLRRLRRTVWTLPSIASSDDIAEMRFQCLPLPLTKRKNKKRTLK